MGSEGLKSGVEFQIQHCWTKSQKLGEPEKYKEMWGPEKQHRPQNNEENVWV